MKFLRMNFKPFSRLEMLIGPTLSIFIFLGLGLTIGEFLSDVPNRVHFLFNLFTNALAIATCFRLYQISKGKCLLILAPLGGYTASLILDFWSSSVHHVDILNGMALNIFLISLLVSLHTRNHAWQVFWKAICPSLSTEETLEKDTQ